MQKISLLSPFRLLFRHPSQRSLKPTYPFSQESLTPIPTRLVPNILPTLCPKSLRNSTHPLSRNLRAWSSTYRTRRKLNTESGGDPVPELDVNKEVDMINLKFAEAREEIEMAMESKETVYFNEEADCARAAVKEVVDMFEGLLAKLPGDQKAALQRSMGLKIEQLKAELQQLDD